MEALRPYDPQPETLATPDPVNACWLLVCPECGEEWIEDPDSTAIVHPDRDQYDSPLNTRGGWVQINLVCSRGHTFALVIANHKGVHMIGYARRVIEPGPLSLVRVAT